MQVQGTGFSARGSTSDAGSSNQAACAWANTP
jgi:hypothetical protein